ncbi:histone deacetylase family protein [Frigoriflavimonas asaccharolytica]|uniref:Acetoin utilization deacetylase AcuC-like enzyme n=1 Tax=Frigoriflavimonas asaccharolytica TaxID=2735899 RepID=A0A8J8G4N5_9FLAO|nr:histone deacetylase [Frigoriflavimonas asaccharolytica]NRS91226.1 acetoin utilization deacetylase AcuC-like enzyme [Frigoriflavimonas asaccharolytica]
MLPITYHPIYKHPLPENHKFPMLKYDLLPQQILLHGIAEETDFFEPNPVDLAHVLAIHEKEYVNSLLNYTLDAKAQRKIGFPLSAALVERELRIAQGTISGCEMAMQAGVAFNIAGGTHHAFSNCGEAFCMLNDQAIAAKYILNKKLATKILIVDLDVHQGNGTAEIFQNEAKVFTFSVHGKNNYPFRKEISDMDIALEDKTADEEYLKIIKEFVPKLIAQQKPDFIFYLSGVDILATDKLGKLGCSIEACRKRDEIVLSLCKKHEIPVQVSMGGGYSPEIKTIVDAHSNTFRVASEIYF